MWSERHLRTGSRTINGSKYLGSVCLWSRLLRMYLKYTTDTQSVSSVVCICKRTWDVLKTRGDITLGHDVQGKQDTCNWGGKNAPRHLPLLLQKDNHYILSNQKLLPMGTFITAIKKTGQGWGTDFWFPQEKNDFQIMTFENARERMTYLQ